MPVYGYRCDHCHHEFERKQSFRDSAEVSCPQCGTNARRVLFPVPVIFKGSGFYVTDSRSPSSTQS